MIKVLSKDVAAKIAAGEVIDRPVSIVKELLENSIDAGADTITVEIKNGGKSYIRVTDNGCGIDESEVETAFQRHATSKITTETDLDAILTLGFRGEALASICAVARVELITKTRDNKMGRKVTIQDSEIVENVGMGCPDGTTITVRDLFYNVPARRKFLYTDNGEARRIIDMVSKIALSYGDIKITLINNNAKVFTTNGKSNIYNNIVNIYGSDIGRDLLPVDNTYRDFIIKGFVSGPSSSTPSRNKQIFCVNGRVISSKVIEEALEEAYKERMFKGRFPIAFLFISIPPNKLDVNIHPTKKEVRFDDNFEIMDFVTNSVKKAIYVKNAIPEIREERRKQPETVSEVSESAVKEDAVAGSSSSNLDFDKVDSPNSKPSAIPVEFTGKSEQVNINNILTTLKEEKEIKKLERELEIEPPISKPLDFSTLKIIGVAFNTYILASAGDELFLIDQHAAHERIFYEKLLRQYNSEEKYRQTLLAPLRFSVTAATAGQEDLWIEPLRKMGYSVELFGTRTYIVREIPAFMSLKEAESFLKDMFASIEDKADLTNTAALDKIISRSCKSAIKGGDSLNIAEIDALIEELESCINPFSCPHGRPTFIRITKREIEKMFKRV